MALLPRAIVAADPASEGRRAVAAKGMVVSVSQPASEAGRDVMKQGGNAVDAAIATAFALAVTWPEAGNIGGGGFMLIHPGRGKKPVVIDYREIAPAAATRDMFAAGKVSQYKLVGVPGTVRGLELAHQKFGQRPWKELLAPAIRLADEGVLVNEPLAASLNDALTDSPAGATEIRKAFAAPDSKWKPGTKLKQPDLAATLRSIADEGSAAFYRGKIADSIVAEMKRGDGLITRADLAAYEAKVREPLHGTFRGYDIYAPPPPSSGGVCLIEMLHMLEALNLKQHPRASPQSVHLMSECMRRAYCDRARHLGDPDFVELPAHLTTPEHAQRWIASIKPDRATPSAELAQALGWSITDESEQTTHFSVVDSAGMAVANTYTLEQSFGARIVVRGAGFLLNNEMGDFNPRPGVTTRSGLIGTAANEVRPHKRMLSSMCPTIVCHEGQPVLVLGSPGGRTIINTVCGVIVNRLEYDLPLADAVDALRFHHQWFPDRIQLERSRIGRHEGLPAALEKLGHTVHLRPGSQGDVHAIEIDPKIKQLTGVADRRRDGYAAGW